MNTRPAKPKHYTLDLETLGTGPTAAILSIGAVAFDHVLEIIESQFYVTVDLASCLSHGLTIDAPTVYWWLSQEKTAQEALLDALEPLDIALKKLSVWVRENLHTDAVCWTHATFDAPILANAYRVAGLSQPTSFRQQRDIRTLVDLAPSTNTNTRRPRIGTHHHALDDARYQAEYIGGMLKKLGHD